MYDRNEIKEIIDEIVFLKKYTLFDKQEYDEKAKVIEELKSDLYNAFEYSCAMKSHFRKFGNQMSGSGNHLCNYASLLA